MSPPAPISPTAADQPSFSPHGAGFPALPQEHYYQSPDFTNFYHDVLPQTGLNEWDLTEEFEVFLRGAQGSGPASSHCAAHLGHLGSKESVESQLNHQDFSSADESMGDLSDLCFQDLGDFNLSDLEISSAMIDYLLG